MIKLNTSNDDELNKKIGEWLTFDQVSSIAIESNNL